MCATPSKTISLSKQRNSGSSRTPLSRATSEAGREQGLGRQPRLLSRLHSSTKHLPAAPGLPANRPSNTIRRKPPQEGQMATTTKESLFSPEQPSQNCVSLGSPVAGPVQHKPGATKKGCKLGGGHPLFTDLQCQAGGWCRQTSSSPAV